MKKLLPIIVILCFVGCAKKYKSVEEYANAMRAVQQSHKSYTLEMKQLTPFADSYLRVYKKNNLWKNQLSTTTGRTFIYNTLFDGVDVFGYGDDTTWATILTSDEMKGNDISRDLFNWDRPKFGLPDMQNNEPQFINHNDKKNGFDCRLIKYGDFYEVCVSDTLGIAVYIKVRLGKDIEIEQDVVKIDTSELPDSTFVLPSDKQKRKSEILDNPKLRDMLNKKN